MLAGRNGGGADEDRIPKHMGPLRSSDVGGGLSAEAIAAQIERAVVSFQRGDTRDDSALVVLVIPPSDLP